VVFGLPKIAQRLPEEERVEQLLPLFQQLARDRVWLVRAASASTLPAMAGLLPPESDHLPASQPGAGASVAFYTEAIGRVRTSITLFDAVYDLGMVLKTASAVM
jgi:hypothetical protein